MCHQYREKVMLLADGELADPDRAETQEHLRVCPECLKEYQQLTRLGDLVCHHSFREPRGEFWGAYYRGVCGKMSRRARYHYWALASFSLVAAGNLMFLSFPDSIPGFALGAVANLSGICLLWLSYFCNCKS
jgi:anti-sigma factor RsiW